MFSIANRSVVQKVTRSVANSNDVVRASVCRLLHPAYAAVGYMDGHITCWALGTNDSFVLRGHTAAVFTIDADQVRPSSSVYDTNTDEKNMHVCKWYMLKISTLTMNILS